MNINNRHRGAFIDLECESWQIAMGSRSIVWVTVALSMISLILKIRDFGTLPVNPVHFIIFIVGLRITQSEMRADFKLPPVQGQFP